MRIYPSCLYNRISEARRHLPSVMIDDWRFVGYPYNVIDFAVRMRPIVKVINSVTGTDFQIPLTQFELSRSQDNNRKYLNKRDVSVIVILNVVIHEKYLLISPMENREGELFLTVESDRGRWTVDFFEFVNALQSYLLNANQVAEIVCDMIDIYRQQVDSDPEKYRQRPPEIGNFDLEWLLSVYVRSHLVMKQTLLHDIFGINSVPQDALTEIRFWANAIGYRTFDLHLSPADWSVEVEDKKRVTWAIFSQVIRSCLPIA